ncbi:MAG: type II toxin-antitoxin system HigB family toxin [Candidatus Hydrogenedens sp.]|nr:type II toxin-antitoxin system HigB family toxin [Candidatus Hydrogenedens sp.]
MRIIAVRTLREFWMQYPESEQPLKAWCAEARAAAWTAPSDIKTRYRSASVLNSERVVFNIGGNKYRLIVSVNYSVGVVFIKFIGTHAAYDQIDARTVEWNPRS